MAVLERAGGYCMGMDGPNLACPGCDLPVGTRMDGCGCWQVVRLDPRAVVRLPGSPPERPVMDGAELLATGALSHRLLASHLGRINAPRFSLAGSPSDMAAAFTDDGTEVRGAAGAHSSAVCPQCALAA
ncbi:hypothetical protein [Streptomyces sp. NPDC051183]|uniref:hypothetical protein n=1 Tax=Streptomyces sp. NPDC051183 TaxID=3155165 RepID=UPI003436511D